MDLQSQSTENLLTLQQEITEELDKRRELEKSKLVSEFIEKAEDLGVPLNDLLADLNRQGGRKTGKLKAKYRNPDNEQETWSGRGRKPAWLVSLLESGKTLEDALIAE